MTRFTEASEKYERSPAEYQRREMGTEEEKLS
jgi:hypothetical protein